MNKMESRDKTENQTRTQEIRIIWKQHQWLYIIVGFVLGLIFTALTQVNTSDFFLNLIPEALGISFGVFVIDRLYRHWQRQRLLKLIKKEIISNLSHMTTKIEGKIMPAYVWGIPAHRNYGKNGTNGIISLTGQQIKWLFMYCFVGTKASQLKTDFIESALTSDTLLLLGNVDFLIEVTLHEALTELYSWLDKRKNINDKSSREYLYNLNRKVIDNQRYPIPNEDIIVPMACINWDINIISWSQSIIASIDSGKSTVVIPKLQPNSPIHQEEEQLSEEIPKPSEVEGWISSWKFDE